MGRSEDESLWKGYIRPTWGWSKAIYQPDKASARPAFGNSAPALAAN